MKSFGLQDLGQYQASGLQNVVEEASPHQLIQMLLDGGLDRIATARAQIAQGDIAGKGLSIGRAIAIVDGLRVSLDHSHSRQLSENLESLSVSRDHKGQGQHCLQSQKRQLHQ